MLGKNKADFHFFQNRACRYFPCHGKGEGTGSVPIDDFNCLFCYCPMYYIKCGGNYKLMDNGLKDCMQCTRNHDKDAWKYIQARTREYMNIKVKFGELNGGK